MGFCWFKILFYYFIQINVDIYLSIDVKNVKLEMFHMRIYRNKKYKQGIKLKGRKLDKISNTQTDTC